MYEQEQIKSVKYKCTVHLVPQKVEGGWGNNLQKFSNMADSDAAGCALLRLMLQGRQRQQPKTNAPERDKLIANRWIIIT